MEWVRSAWQSAYTNQSMRFCHEATKQKNCYKTRRIRFELTTENENRKKWLFVFEIEWKFVSIFCFHFWLRFVTNKIKHFPRFVLDRGRQHQPAEKFDKATVRPRQFPNIFLSSIFNELINPILSMSGIGGLTLWVVFYHVWRELGINYILV